jgi:hypothetical protein
MRPVNEGSAFLLKGRVQASRKFHRLDVGCIYLIILQLIGQQDHAVGARLALTRRPTLDLRLFGAHFRQERLHNVDLRRSVDQESHSMYRHVAATYPSGVVKLLVVGPVRREGQRCFGDTQERQLHAYGGRTHTKSVPLPKSRVKSTTLPLVAACSFIRICGTAFAPCTQIV